MAPMYSMIFTSLKGLPAAKFFKYGEYSSSINVSAFNFAFSSFWEILNTPLMLIFVGSWLVLGIFAVKINFASFLKLKSMPRFMSANSFLYGGFILSSVN